MSRLLLDSAVLIDALRGRPAAERVRGLRRAGVEPWVCAISVVGAALATANTADFPMPELELEHWPGAK